MIPGLHIDEVTEGRIRSSFGSWAGHFREPFFAKGLPWLVARYAAVVDSIRTQQCTHGSGGATRTGRDWQTCCGVSYEYHNDIAVRDALDIVFQAAAAGVAPQLRQHVALLDDTLYALFPEGHPRQLRWWHDGLPKGVLD